MVTLGPTTQPAPTRVPSPIVTCSRTTACSSMLTPWASLAWGCTMALGWIAAACAWRPCSQVPTRAKASRGWGVMSSGLAWRPLAANSPAITAVAFEERAWARFFLSSTKTRSPGAADCRLATPVTWQPPSPSSDAPRNSATSSSVRFTASCIAGYGGQEKRRARATSCLECGDAAQGVLAGVLRPSGSGVGAALLVAGAGGCADYFYRVVVGLPERMVSVERRLARRTGLPAAMHPEPLVRIAAHKVLDHLREALGVGQDVLLVVSGADQGHRGIGAQGDAGQAAGRAGGHSEEIDEDALGRGHVGVHEDSDGGALLDGAEQFPGGIVLEDGRIAVQGAVAADQGVEVGIIERPHDEVERVAVEGMGEGRELPAPQVSGEEEHALAALGGAVKVLKAVIDHDFTHVLCGVAGKPADFGKLAP